MISAGHDGRKQALNVASFLTEDPSDVISLMMNAGTLLYWLEEAPDEEDLRLRQAVMDRHHANVFYVAGRSGLTAEVFLTGCRALHDFVTAAIVIPDAVDLKPEAA